MPHQSVAAGEEADGVTMVAPALKLVEGVIENVTVLEVYGRLDSATAQEFSDRLIALVQASRAIVVDFKSVAYISSAGFRVLLIANRVATEKRSKLALCGVIGEVRRLFEIGGFTERFLICHTPADGIGQLTQ
jgi:anti-anti-sigma factor